MAPPRLKLPIDDVLPRICEAVRGGSITAVVAPPGAGKTTRVPPALLDAGVAGDGAVVMLQPRRIAARMTARRMAEERGSVLGAEVGYAVKHDKKMTRATRIRVLTEGLLTRLLQADPFLEGVGCVILDEFHERSLHADLALALLYDIQRQVRPDLKIVLMSATLDVDKFKAVFPEAPIIEVAGRTHPIEVHWRASQGGRLSEHVAAVVAEFAPQAPLRADGQPGDVLVFLPGRAEIRHSAQRLASAPFVVQQLHGGLSGRQQDEVLRRGGPQRVILSTNVAETSLTLPDVTLVIDSGLARRPTEAGERLRTGPISGASATQRAGRAGRTRAGLCVRLWSEFEHQGRRPHDPPAILREDLTSLLLEVASWGAALDSLLWFDAPTGAAVDRARALLERLGATADGELTAFGRSLAELPMHPRLGAVLLAGREAGLSELAATAVACLSEGLNGGGATLHRDSDLEEAMAALRARARGDRRRDDFPPRVMASALKTRDRLMGKSSAGSASDSDDRLAELLVRGFPDRVAMRRGQGQSFKLADGRGATLSPRSCVQRAQYIVALEMGARDGSPDPVVYVAAAIEAAQLQTKEVRQVTFDAQRRAVTARTQRRYGALTFSSQPTKPTLDEAHSALLDSLAGRALEALRLRPEAALFLERVRWLADHAPELELPTFTELDPGATLEEGGLLERWCHGLRSWDELAKLDHEALLRQALTWPQNNALETHAPSRLKLRCGRHAKLRYHDDGSATASAKLQYFFGMETSPTLAMGRALVRCELLAPNGRSAQITSDLAGFWSSTWREVRGSLRGRYPKHPWPERPTLEDATRGRRRKDSAQ